MKKLCYIQLCLILYDSNIEFKIKGLTGEGNIAKYKVRSDTKMERINKRQLINLLFETSLYDKTAIYDP